MSKKLIEERAILLFPSLATEIGLNNAIFLQQLHFWLDIAKELGYGVKHENEVWVYKSAEEWQEKDFPFWSVKTIRRIINNLNEQGLIVVAKLNQDKWNHTFYYRINYSHCQLRSGQVVHIEADTLSSPIETDRPHVTENTTKNTSEITSKKKANFSKKEVSKAVSHDSELNLNLSDKQIDYFGNLLANNPNFGSTYANVGEPGADFAKRIKKLMKDPTWLSSHIADLEAVGFKRGAV